MWILTLTGLAVLEKMIFENGGRQMDGDGRTPDDVYTISSL